MRDEAGRFFGLPESGSHQPSIGARHIDVTGSWPGACHRWPTQCHRWPLYVTGRTGCGKRTPFPPHTTPRAPKIRVLRGREREAPWVLAASAPSSRPRLAPCASPLRAVSPVASTRKRKPRRRRVAAAVSNSRCYAATPKTRSLRGAPTFWPTVSPGSARPFRPTGSSWRPESTG